MINLLAPMIVMVAPVEASPALTPDQVVLAGEVTTMLNEWAVIYAEQGLQMTTSQWQAFTVANRQLFLKYANQGMSLAHMYKAVASGAAATKLGLEYKFLLQMLTRQIMYTAELVWSVAHDIVHAGGTLTVTPAIFFPWLDWSYTGTGEYMAHPDDLAYMWVPDNLYVDWQMYPDEWAYSGEEGSDEDKGRIVITGSTASYSNTEQPGAYRPKLKHDSTKAEDGRWTEAGCFPPLPLPDDYFVATVQDITVECTPDMEPADLVFIGGYPYWAMETAIEDQYLLVTADVVGYEMGPVSMVVNVF